MTVDRVLYTGIIVILAMLLVVFFVFVANVDQSFPAIALGWVIAVLSLQVGKILRPQQRKASKTHGQWAVAEPQANCYAARDDGQLKDSILRSDELNQTPAAATSARLAHNSGVAEREPRQTVHCQTQGISSRK